VDQPGSASSTATAWSTAVAAPALPRDMIAFLAAGQPALDATCRDRTAGARLPLADVRLEAPCRGPAGFSASASTMPTTSPNPAGKPWVPIFFNKQSTCVVGPSDPVHLPRASALLDYEGELAS
jgi:2-keto-4-pentenoate hydratase/2-oxohepta-3-ene-1,7-dioic acid hydratase in catechol pathway